MSKKFYLDSWCSDLGEYMDLSPYSQEHVEGEGYNYMRVKFVVANGDKLLNIESRVGIEGGNAFFEFLARDVDTGERSFMKYVSPNRRGLTVVIHLLPYLVWDDKSFQKLMALAEGLQKGAPRGDLYLYFDTSSFSQGHLGNDAFFFKKGFFGDTLGLFFSLFRFEVPSGVFDRVYEHGDYAFLSSDNGLHVVMRKPSRRGKRRVLDTTVHFGKNEVSDYPAEFEWARRFIGRQEPAQQISPARCEVKYNRSHAFSMPEWSKLLTFEIDAQYNVRLHAPIDYGLAVPHRGYSISEFLGRTLREVYSIKLVVPPNIKTLTQYLDIRNDEVLVRVGDAFSMHFTNVPPQLRPRVAWLYSNNDNYFLRVNLPQPSGWTEMRRPKIIFAFPKVVYSIEDIKRLVLDLGLEIFDSNRIQSLVDAKLLENHTIYCYATWPAWGVYLGDGRYRTADGEIGVDELIQKDEAILVLNIDDFLKDLGLYSKKESTQELDESEEEEVSL